jgi:hypothetical protein
MDVDAEQPPDQKDRYDSQEKVAEPLAWSTWPAEVEHAAMVAQRLRLFSLLGGRDAGPAYVGKELAGFCIDDFEGVVE